MLSEQRRQKNRDNLGKRLKDARIEAGYTQKALAEEIGLDYYTVISQMELGYMAIPSAMWVPIANALKMDKSEWVIRCVLEYYPEVYEALFAKRSRNQIIRLLSALQKGQLDEIVYPKE